MGAVADMHQQVIYSQILSEKMAFRNAQTIQSPIIISSSIPNTAEYENEQPEQVKLRKSKKDRKIIICQDRKYFCMQIGYPDFKKALIERGWIELPKNCGNDQFCDLKFALNQGDLPIGVLKKDCIINHVRGEGSITCKSAIVESLNRSEGSFHFISGLAESDAIDTLGLGSQSFFPRQYVLNQIPNINEFQNDFAVTTAESILGIFVSKASKLMSQSPPKYNAGIPKQLLLVCCNIVKRKFKATWASLDKKQGICGSEGNFASIKLEERNFIFKVTPL